MARMTNDKLVSMTYAEIQKSDGYMGQSVSENITQALDYYYARPGSIPSAKGKSAVISSDVADMTHAILAHMDSSLALNCQAEFEPKDEADEDQARVESAFCQDLIMNKANGYVSLLEAFKDALLLRNGIMKVWVEVTEEVERNRFSKISDEELAAAMIGAEEENKTVELQFREPDGGAATLKITTEHKAFKVESVPRENFLTEPGLDSIYLDQARFVAERVLVTRSELIEQGISKSQVEKLKPITTETWSDSNARRRDQETEVFTAEEPSMDRIEVFDCAYRVDFDGTGVAQLWRVRVADRQLLSKERIDFAPYVAGTAWLEPHQFAGLSVFDLLRSTQEQKTAFLRQWIDNATTNNNARMAVVENQVRMGDVLNSRAGGAIRMTAPGAVTPLPVNDVGPSCQLALNYLDKIRTERAGAALDMSSAEIQVSGNGGINGVERQVSSREMTSAMLTRTMAETLMRSLYLLVHKTARSFMTGQHQFRTSGAWQATSPNTWPQRSEIAIKVGMSAGERTKRVSSLRENIQMQMAMTQAGMAGQMVDNDTLYRSVIDWGKAAEIDIPENYYIDPGSEEAQQAAQQAQQAQQGQQQMQQQLAGKQLAMAEQAAQLEARKVADAGIEAARKIEFDYFNARLDSEVEEAKIIGTATLDLERAQLQAEGKENGNGNDGGAGGA